MAASSRVAPVPGTCGLAELGCQVIRPPSKRGSETEKYFDDLKNIYKDMLCVRLSVVLLLCPVRYSVWRGVCSLLPDEPPLWTGKHSIPRDEMWLVAASSAVTPNDDWSPPPHRHQPSPHHQHSPQLADKHTQVLSQYISYYSQDSHVNCMDIPENVLNKRGRPESSV